MGLQAGGGAARSQTARGRAGPGNPSRARAGAGGEGHPGRYLLLDLPVLRDDPVRGGEGPSSCHTQQGGKAEKPAWTGARRQLAPSADPYCRRHLAPPSPGAHTGSGNGPPPFAILGRSTLEEEEEPRGRCLLTTGFLGLGLGLGGGEARPLTLAQFGFRSATAFSLLFSCARYDLGAWEPEGEKSSVPVGA